MNYKWQFSIAMLNFRRVHLDWSTKIGIQWLNHQEQRVFQWISVTQVEISPTERDFAARKSSPATVGILPRGIGSQSAKMVVQHGSFYYTFHKPYLQGPQSLHDCWLLNSQDPRIHLVCRLWLMENYPHAVGIVGYPDRVLICFDHFWHGILQEGTLFNIFILKFILFYTLSSLQPVDCVYSIVGLLFGRIPRSLPDSMEVEHRTWKTKAMDSARTSCVGGEVCRYLQTSSNHFFSSSKFLAVQTNNHDSLGFSGLMVGTGFQHQLYADMQAFIPFLLTHSCCGESVESRIKRFSCSLCCRNEQRNVAMGGLLMDPGGSLRPTFWYSVWNYRRRSQQLQQRERWPWDVSCFVEASQSHSWPWAICHTFFDDGSWKLPAGLKKVGKIDGNIQFLCPFWLFLVMKIRIFGIPIFWLRWSNLGWLTQMHGCLYVCQILEPKIYQTWYVHPEKSYKSILSTAHTE